MPRCGLRCPLQLMKDMTDFKTHGLIMMEFKFQMCHRCVRAWKHNINAHVDCRARLYIATFFLMSPKSLDVVGLSVLASNSHIFDR